MRAEEPRRATGDRLGADALDLLAEVLFPRLDELVSERIESLGPQADGPSDDGWLQVSEVAERKPGSFAKRCNWRAGPMCSRLRTTASR